MTYHSLRRGAQNREVQEGTVTGFQDDQIGSAFLCRQQDLFRRIPMTDHFDQITIASNFRRYPLTELLVL